MEPLQRVATTVFWCAVALVAARVILALIGA